MSEIFHARFDAGLDSFSAGTQVSTKGSAAIADAAGALQIGAGVTATRDFTNITSGSSRCDFWYKVEDSSIAASASTIIYLMENGVIPASGSSLCAIALSRSNSSSGSVLRITYRDNVGAFIDIPCGAGNLEIYRGAWWIKISVILNHSAKVFDLYVEDKMFVRAAPWPNSAAIGFGRFAIIAQAAAPDTWFDNIRVEDAYSYGESVLIDHTFVGGAGEIEASTPATSLREAHAQPWFIAPDVVTYGAFTLGANGAVPDASKINFALQRCGADGVIEIEFRTSVSGVAYFGMYFRFWDYPSNAGAGAGVFRVSGSGNTAILQLPDRAGNLQTVQSVALTPLANTTYTLKLEMRGRYLIGSYKASAMDAGSYIQIFVHAATSSAAGGRGMLSEELAGPMIATTIGAIDNYVRRFRFTGKSLAAEATKTVGPFKYAVSDASIREMYATGAASPTKNLFLSKGIQLGHRSSADQNAAIQQQTIYDISNLYAVRQYGATLSEYEHLGKADCFITLLRRGPWISDNVLPFVNSENFAPDLDLLPGVWSTSFRTILNAGASTLRSDATYHDWVGHNSGATLPAGNQAITTFATGQQYLMSQVVVPDIGLTGAVWDITSKFEGSGDPISRAISTAGTNLVVGANVRVARGFLIRPDTGLSDTVLTNWRDDLKTPATLTFTAGSAKTNASGDTNADGFNERHGWYEIQCAAGGDVAWTLPVGSGVRYQPVFRLHGFTTKTSLIVNGVSAVPNTDYVIDTVESGVAVLQILADFSSNANFVLTDAVATLTGNNSIQSNSSSTGSITTAAGTKSVSTTLVNVSGTPLSNLSGLRWAFFDQSNVSALSMPVASGSSGSTDANGLFAVNVTTSLPVGSAGWLIITNSDGNPATNHKCYAGPAVVS